MKETYTVRDWKKALRMIGALKEHYHYTWSTTLKRVTDDILIIIEELQRTEEAARQQFIEDERKFFRVEAGISIILTIGILLGCMLTSCTDVAGMVIFCIFGAPTVILVILFVDWLVYGISWRDLVRRRKGR